MTATTATTPRRVLAAASKALLSTQEAADLLQVRRPTITRLIRQGRLRAVRKSERLILVDRASAIDYLRRYRCPGYGAPRKDGSSDSLPR
jgi:excisionase family DNA binding protein